MLHPRNETTYRKALPPSPVPQKRPAAAAEAVARRPAAQSPQKVLKVNEKGRKVDAGKHEAAKKRIQPAGFELWRTTRERIRAELGFGYIV